MHTPHVNSYTSKVENSNHSFPKHFRVRCLKTMVTWLYFIFNYQTSKWHGVTVNSVFFSPEVTVTMIIFSYALVPDVN